MNAERWKTVERLFHEASAISGSGRTRYLDHHCAGDEELRRELEELLKQDQMAPLDIRLAIAEAARELLGTKGPKR